MYSRQAWLLGLVLTIPGIEALGTEQVTVDISRVVNSTAAHGVGINVIYLMDAERARPLPPRQTTAEALEAMGVRYLRYPGGEIADTYLWSAPPFSTPIPTLARTGPDEWPASSRQFTESDDGRWIAGKEPLDFDEFMTICQALGAEPVLVVAYDSAYKPKSGGGTTTELADLIETAAEWVRYANITRGYGVKYWEIGNETYLTSGVGKVTAERYAVDFAKYAKAMKKVDASIKLGANGQQPSWFSKLFANAQAAAAIDFLTVHDYPTYHWYEGYEHYRSPEEPELVDFAAPLDEILAAIPAAHKDRVRIALTEVNAIDWDKAGWPPANDLGHTLVLFDMLGQRLSPRMISSQ